MENRISASGMKKYLENVYKLERSVYLQQCVCNSILRKRKKYQSWEPQKLKQVEVNKPDVREKNGVVFTICIAISWIGAISELLKAHIGLMLIFFLGGTFLAAIITQILDNSLSEAKYKELYEKEKKKVDEENKNIQFMNEVHKKDNDRVIAALNEEYAIAERQLKQTKEILRKMYEKDIIFLKYRNLIAVSSFYEYFCSGRCDCLTGHEGAYNIYESEVRQNLIIQKLDEVVSRLDQIEKNQYMLYDAIRETNYTINRLGKNLDDSLGKLDSKMNSVVTNTYISSYNSERQLENSRFQTFLAINYLT